MGFLKDVFDLSGGDVLSSAIKLGGGIANAITGNNAQQREYERQKEFAQNGIRWKVEDAKAAGIHPIFAVGANTATYSPQAAVGTDYGLSEVGQNISRAIEAKQTRDERLANLLVTRDVGEAQANYYNAAAKNQLAQANLAEGRLVSPTDLLRDYPSTLGINSLLASKNQSTQKPPAMPNSSDISKSGVRQFDFLIDEYGHRVALANSQDYHDIYEDIPGVELVPPSEGFIKNIVHKWFSNKPIQDSDGRWWIFDLKKSYFVPYEGYYDRAHTYKGKIRGLDDGLHHS